jgi:tRNA(Ile)-lysidine synthase
VRDFPEPSSGDAVVVALSGGLDSTVLLHLLRFTPGLPELRLVGAHVDHAMRPSSAADAAWVRGLCVAWGLPCRVVRLDPAPVSEATARQARYAFLRDVLAREGARLIATAHHADDQAETVLFRVLRGTGVGGLAGIPRRSGRLWRPLLAFERAEIDAYARAAGLRWRDDPSNRDVRIARNALRHEVLPTLEAGPAPHARRALVALAQRARQDEEGWASLLPELLEPLKPRREAGRISLLRDGILRYHPAVRAQLLRALARELGRPLSGAGTRAALEFTSHGSSGRARRLSGTLTLGREFDRLVLAESGTAGVDRRVVIHEAVGGSGRLWVGGRPFTVTWGSELPAARWHAAFSLDDVRFPVEVRGWAPGDRMRLEYGTKKLKKLFQEARIPASERRCLPVVAEASGRVLWVPGVARAAGPGQVSGGDLLRIAIVDADSD